MTISRVDLLLRDSASCARQQITGLAVADESWDAYECERACLSWEDVCVHGTHVLAHAGGVLVTSNLTKKLISENQQQHAQLGGQHDSTGVKAPAPASELLRHAPAGRWRHAEHADPWPVREGYRKLQP